MLNRLVILFFATLHAPQKPRTDSKGLDADYLADTPSVKGTRMVRFTGPFLGQSDSESESKLFQF